MATAREIGGDGVPMNLGLREDVDEVRLVERKSRVVAASSLASRCGVTTRMEGSERRRDSGGLVAVAMLRKKRKGGHQRVRLDERSRRDQKVEALAHRVVDDELNTAAVLMNSGEEYPQPGGAVEGEKGAR